MPEQPKHQSHHFADVIDKIEAYEGVVIATSGKNAAIVQVQKVRTHHGWQVAQGRVQLSFRYKKLPQLRYGCLLRVQGKPQALAAPSNPHVTNYNNQWYVQGVFHTHYLPKVSFMGVSYPNIIAYQGWKWRHYFVKKLVGYFDDEEVLGVVLSLLLGERSYLAEDVKTTYVVTGVIHVLAVSGLHIGLIYMLLLWLFCLIGSLLRRPYQYRWLAVICLWMYALLTGFSPSVLRAVGILSLVVWGGWLGRDIDRVNLTGALFFFFCLYNPYLLFDVGFQLSFTAFLSILIFYQPIVALYQPAGRYKRSCWKTTALSLAVQVGTLPISLYHFRFFSSYFLFANWLMLPLMPLLLGLGLGVLLLAWSSRGAMPLVWCLNKLISTANDCLAYIEGLPGAYLGPFHIALWEVGLYYGVVGICYFGIKRRKLALWLFTAVLLCLWGGTTIYKNLARKSQRGIIIYQVASHCVMAFIKGEEADIVSDKILHANTNYYVRQVKPILSYLRIKKIHQHNLKESGDWAFFNRKEKGIQQKVWHGKSIVVLPPKSKPPPVGMFNPCTLPRKIDLLIIENKTMNDLTAWQGVVDVGLLVVGNRSRHKKALIHQAIKYGIPYHNMANGALTMYW